ncbi:2135_t:CDS:2, partial [Gigaspora margarita]
IVMKLQRLKKITGKLPSEFPEGFQFKIHAYNSVNGNEFVRIDNHENKPPHYHPVNDLATFPEILINMKKFIIQYNPNYSLGKMFENFEQAIAGQKHLQPKNVIVFSDLTTVYQVISQARLDLLTCLNTNQPANIYQLTQLLKRDYANVWRDCQALNSLGIIELKKEGKEIRPIALYDEIDLQMKMISQEKPAATHPLLHSFKEIEKEEFSQKNLFQNQILKSAIAGEKNNLLILSISKDDQVSRGIIRKLQAINITKTITPNREAQDDYEIWLLEKDKVPSSLLSE